MAWRWPGDKPLSEPMMVRLLMHICVNELKPLSSFQYQGIILNAWDNNVFNIALWALCLEVLEHMLFEDLFPLFAEHLIAFYQGYVDWMVCLGPIQLMIFDAKLNSDLNHIRSHSNFCASDHYNFFTCHDSYAVVACTKFCGDDIIMIWKKVKWNYHHIWLVCEKISSDMGGWGQMLAKLG